MLKYILPVIPTHDTYIATFAGKYLPILRKSKCLLNIRRERAIESALNVLR